MYSFEMYVVAAGIVAEPDPRELFVKVPSDCVK
jgi:hypothetical protein